MTTPATPLLDTTVNKDAVKGKKNLVLLRKLGDSEKAGKLIYTTEFEFGMSKDSDSEATNDGPIVIPGEIEYELSLTSYMATNDPTYNMLQTCMMENEKVELWMINLQHEEPSEEEDGAKKYAARYFHTYVTNITETAPTDELMELELEFSVDGLHADGWATVDASQEETARIEFVDTTAKGRASQQDGMPVA